MEDLNGELVVMKIKDFHSWHIPVSPDCQMMV